MRKASPPFTDLTPEEAERFMKGNNNPIRERVAELVGESDVIDLGCGSGIRVKELYTPDQYLGVDCSWELIKKARIDNPCHKFSRADIGAFTTLFDDKAWTCGVMISVLEHQPTLERALDLYIKARRLCETLYIGWGTPPKGSDTRIIKVKAELDEPIYQNRYAQGSFPGAVRVERFGDCELWTVRD